MPGYIHFGTTDRGMVELIFDAYPEDLPECKIEKKRTGREIEYIFKNLDADIFHEFIKKCEREERKIASELEKGVKGI